MAGEQGIEVPLGTVIDGYTIEERVAEGGFGVVFRAHNPQKGRRVALKVLKPAADRDEASRAVFRQAFRQEALLLARVRHASLVEIFDVGETELSLGCCSWMALEWLEGETLRQDLLARRSAGGRSPDEAVALLRPVLDALALLHAEGIAHRDLKPANIVLAHTRHGVVPTVIDLGIARPMEEGVQAGTGKTETLSNLHVFSLSYAAPEQVSGTRTGPWTDVHALGLILTELLVDMPPYPGKDRTEIMQCVLAPTRPTPLLFGRSVGPLQQVLERATAIRPADRYPNAGALLEAIDRALQTPAAIAAWSESAAQKPAISWDRTMEMPDSDAFGLFASEEDRTRLVQQIAKIPVAIAPKPRRPPPPRTGVRPSFLAAVVVLSGTAIALTLWGFVQQNPIEPAPDTRPLVTTPALPPPVAPPPVPVVPTAVPVAVAVPLVAVPIPALGVVDASVALPPRGHASRARVGTSPVETPRNTASEPPPSAPPHWDPPRREVPQPNPEPQEGVELD